MRYFCSKDCPDLCKFDISKDRKIVPYVRKSTQIASVCGKLKGFYKRELLTTDRSYILKNGVKYFQDNDSILKKLALFLSKNRHKKILFLRGSGSLGYNMGYWDFLFSHFNNCYFIDGSPCDETGISAQLEDFGVCMNPDIENLQSSKNIILFGKNAYATSRHLFLYLKKLKKNHKIIYIDPIKTKTASIADRYIRMKPATDGLLAAAILSKKGLISGFDNKELINHIGIEERDFLYLCDNIVESNTAFIMGTGLQRYINGKNIVQWIDRLASYTNNLDTLYYGNGRSSLENFKKLTINKKHRINIAEIPRYLKNNFFDIIVVVAGNPTMTYPESNAWKYALKSTPLIVVDTNITQTAEYADFFIKVGGMFTQADTCGSYFFNVDAKREQFSSKFLSDLDVIKKLSQFLNIDIKIKKVDDIYSKRERHERTLIDKNLTLKYPKNNDGYRIITSSNYFYLNSQHNESTKNRDNFIYISKKIAKDNDILDGQKIILENEMGSIEGICNISDMINGNTIMIYKNKNLSNGTPNKITKSLPTDSHTGIAYYDAFATIKKPK